MSPSPPCFQVNDDDDVFFPYRTLFNLVTHSQGKIIPKLNKSIFIIHYQKINPQRTPPFSQVRGRHLVDFTKSSFYSSGFSL